MAVKSKMKKTSKAKNPFQAAMKASGKKNPFAATMKAIAAKKKK